MSSPTQTFLRHTLATLAYRAGRVCESAPPGFSDFRAAGSPMLGENYFKADIAVGRVGKDPGAAAAAFN